jgi:hypothetical protein
LAILALSGQEATDVCAAPPGGESPPGASQSGQAVSRGTGNVVWQTIQNQFGESYYSISAKGKKLSEAKSAAEAQQVAAGVRKLYGDGQVSGPHERFTAASISRGITDLLQGRIRGPGSSPGNGTGGGTRNGIANGAPGKGTPPKTNPPAKPKDPVATTKKKSGKDWVKEFPTSRSTDDLSKDFKPKFQGFQKALQSAGATTSISATLRPPQRAYLMHYAWRIVNENLDASKIPARADVPIEWWHGNQADSVRAAREMVNTYGINPQLKVPPSLTSRHIEGNAVDMSVSWSGTLTIQDASGKEHIISSTPRNHTNPDLIRIAASYGVIHYTEVAKDPGHWSTDGR